MAAETVLPPINLQQWITENQDLLQPPVCNKVVFQDKDFLIMLVGGPNSRSDYHYDPFSEFFYQIKGDMTLKTIQNGKPKDITIKEGEMFLLPAEIPHSPQRTANSIGLVIEKIRKKSDKDGLQWYCSECNHLLYEEYFSLQNIETDLQPVFHNFSSNEQLKSCDNCNHINSF